MTLAGSAFVPVREEPHPARATSSAAAPVAIRRVHRMAENVNADA
jgi:hypothetical protein